MSQISLFREPDVDFSLSEMAWKNNHYRMNNLKRASSEDARSQAPERSRKKKKRNCVKLNLILVWRAFGTLCMHIAQPCRRCRHSEAPLRDAAFQVAPAHNNTHHTCEKRAVESVGPEVHLHF